MFEIIIVLAACFILLYILGLFTKDNSKVDIFWGLGFIIIAWGIYISWIMMTASHYAIIMLVTAWWLRLAYNITKKQLKHAGEDFRYAAWRKSWDYFYFRSFFQIHVLQFILMCLVAIPIFVMYSDIVYQNSILLICGSAIALFGLIYESVADKQLADFMKIKKPWEILTSGLRRYHRYPQYFWESIFWLGIAFISVQANLLGMIGWIFITILVRYVSWVPLLEARYKWDKAYVKYSEDTPVFMPDWRK